MNINLKIITKELEKISNTELEIIINLLEQECEWPSINIIFQSLKDIQENKRELEIAIQIKKNIKNEICKVQKMLKQNMLDETKLILQFNMVLAIKNLAGIDEKIKKLKGEQNAQKKRNYKH